MLCTIPDRFIDVSEFRDVPDHQEVHADETADESIIIEILNLAPGNSMEEAGAEHWKQLLRLNRAQASQVGEVVVSDLADTLPNLVLPPGTQVQPETLLLMGQMQAPKFNETALNSVDVFMLVLRLHDQASDVLIVLNSPVAINPQSSSSRSFLAPNPEGSLALFKRIVSSFRIADWGLFP
jgi:hypothetical protein